MTRDYQKSGEAFHWAHEQGLMPWDKVAEEFNRRTGEHVTRAGAWTICQRAEKKLRKLLQEGGIRHV